MNKQDISKLALMGLMSGLLVNSPANAVEDKEDNGGEAVNLLAAGCGGGSGSRGHGCGGSSSPSNTQGQRYESSNYSTQPQQNSNYNNWQQSSPYYSSPIADESMNAPRQTSTRSNVKQWTESEFISKLSKEGKNSWDRFDVESKRSAIALANKEGLNPDDAVKITLKIGKRPS